MRAAVLAFASAFVTGALVGPAAAETPGVVAVYWEPPGEPAPGREARAAFREAVRPLGARFVDATSTEAAAPSLAPALEAARADYARFAFAPAITRLDELARLTETRGGGDLDPGQLSEIYFYRGLCRLETAAPEAAWEDFVRAARLAPARVVDPARFPPRAVAAYNRAVAEVARLPRARLAVDAPPDAAIRLDGAPAAPANAVTFGAHFVAVTAVGFSPWATVVTVAGGDARVEARLQPALPPDDDRLLALAAGDGAGDRFPSRVLFGALERGASGWRFVARDVRLPARSFVGEAIALENAPVSPSVASLMRRLSPVAPEAAAPRTRWWPWLVAGGAAAVVATGISLGVVYGTASPSGTVGGPLGPLR